jgi:hypothetical protein
MSEDNTALEQYTSVPKGQTSENIQIPMHLSQRITYFYVSIFFVNKTEYGHVYLTAPKM